MDWTTIHRADGVTVEHARSAEAGPTGHHSEGIYITDTGCEHVKLVLRIDEDGEGIVPSFAAEWSEKKPGELADFTHDIHTLCLRGEILIDDTGKLTALGSGVYACRGYDPMQFKVGFSAQLPVAFVEPVRIGIEAAFAAADARKAAARAA